MNKMNFLGINNRIQRIVALVHCNNALWSVFSSIERLWSLNLTYTISEFKKLL